MGCCIRRTSGWIASGAPTSPRLKGIDCLSTPSCSMVCSHPTRRSVSCYRQAGSASTEVSAGSPSGFLLRWDRASSAPRTTAGWTSTGSRRCREECRSGPTSCVGIQLTGLRLTICIMTGQRGVAPTWCGVTRSSASVRRLCWPSLGVRRARDGSDAGRAGVQLCRPRRQAVGQSSGQFPPFNTRRPLAAFAVISHLPTQVRFES
jgi:hypothetical protein